jgi:hypothetical protein
MAFDLSKIPSVRRERYIWLGKQYSSEDTLAQAAQTLQGFARYGAEVADFGYVKKDADALAQAPAALPCEACSGSSHEAGRKSNKNAPSSRGFVESPRRAA